MIGIKVWWQRTQGYLLFLYVRLVTLTVRWQIDGKANLTLARASCRPLLWTLWHGQLMAYFNYVDRFEDVRSFVVVAVGDERHRILDTMGTRFGARTFAVNMGGNPLASGRAVLRVIQAMKDGNQSMIAPDGPDGPPFVPKPGVAAIARKTAAAVLPVGIWTRHAYQMKRWDRYLIPYPFACIHMVIGKPILASKKMDRASLLTQISSALDDVRSQAQLAAGAISWR